MSSARSMAKQMAWQWFFSIDRERESYQKTSLRILSILSCSEDTVGSSVGAKLLVKLRQIGVLADYKG